MALTSMIAKILAILVVVLIGVIILQPSDFRITRTAAIAAPPPVVFAQVNDPTTKAWIVYPRQNSLALALRELGRIERTLFTLHWLQIPRCADGFRQASTKGKRGTPSQELFSSIDLVIAAISLWNTVYLERAILALRSNSRSTMLF